MLISQLTIRATGNYAYELVFEVSLFFDFQYVLPFGKHF